MRPRVYVAGPIRKGDLQENIRKACDVGYELAKLGYAPFVPHLSCYFDGPMPNAEGRLNAGEWIDIDLQWVAASQGLVRIAGESEGADMEVEHAKRHGVPVAFIDGPEYAVTADLSFKVAGVWEQRPERTIWAWQQDVHNLAVAKGWWNDGKRLELIPEKLALVHSEISEALEDYRSGKRPTDWYRQGEKPCGFGVELADAVIRIMDLAEAFGVDLGASMAQKHAYNAKRPERHGGKVC